MTSEFQPQQQAKVSLVQRMLAFPLRHLQQAIGSLGDLWRTPFTTLMTLLVLGISLTLPATLHLFVKNANTVVAQWDSASEITLFLKLNINDKAAQNFTSRVELYPEVAAVEYISAEQALKDFKAHSGYGDALAYLDSNPLPATLLVSPTQRASQAHAVRDLLAKLEQEREVDQGKLDLEWLTRLEAMAKLIEDVVIGVALLLCLSVVLIIGNTIRLAILNQKDAIAVMKLVGATDSFIQRPFMYAGMWYGIAGGFFANLAIFILAHYLSGAITDLTGLYGSKFELETLSASENLILLFAAILLGLLGSYLSVRQHIRAIEPTAD
ncbi:permease-like cell division protein FtsX [Thalassotalea euphylliae]|uniref:Cell division protein FtsX n=1 Tax=Thalassotalea euphylliae TaxID=1655234 RepID=A0A3E0UJZ3_9GAMM|nr:permease-like cell division protein FtsX [Thalassotalea euphylliae]REL37200.1 cell division protein FtsX [Thalassotalea euphylliae]